jgi:hypothetical protein
MDFKDARRFGVTGFISIHRLIACLNQAVKVVIIGRVGRHSETRGHFDCDTVYYKRCGYLCTNFLRYRGNSPFTFVFRQQDDKFVAAESACRVGSTNTIRKTQRYLLQNGVAHRMAKRIVDVLEAIQIEEQQNDLLMPPRCYRDCLIEMVA